MKRNTTIVLFASIFAVAMGTLAMSGNSASSLMVSAVPQTQENVGMLGHVEYTLLDDAGNIKGYMQNDNVVVVAGKDCAAQKLFTNDAVGIGECIAGSGAFSWIAIGNGTVGSTTSVGALNNTLADTGVPSGTGDDSTQVCAYNGPAGGLLAMRNATIDTVADITSAGTTTIVTIDTSDSVGGPFKFVASNATTVKDSGLFNQLVDGYDATNGRCVTDEPADDAAGTGNMFSRQLLNGITGITVTDGDSLSVKWTITVG